MASGSKKASCLILMRILELTGKKLWSLSFCLVGLHMHSVPQNKDKPTINNLP